jgi:hypothetical protein
VAALPRSEQRPELEQQQGGYHLHLHGLTPEEIAAILSERRRLPGR